MTTQLTPDKAMDALVAARPRNEDVEQAWYIGRRERVLQHVLSSSGSPSHSTTALREGAGRRWALIAVAAAFVVVLGLFAQVLLPLGSAGSPQVAQALDRLAAAVPMSPVVPDGAYELTVYTESGLAETDHGKLAYNTRRSTWTAADGWAWAHQTGDDAAWYIFKPSPRNYDLNAVPADPTVMEAYLRARVLGSSSVEEALFEAVRETLMFTPTPAATRIAAIRMLARVPGVTVDEDAADPSGRDATEVRFVDEDHRPGIVNAMYLDPSNTQLMAEQMTENGKPYYTCLYTERRIVKQLPADIIRVLGVDREEKSIDG
jgi:hypothetical protein